MRGSILFSVLHSIISISLPTLGNLRINLATPVNDYYGSVQSVHALPASDKLFEGIIHYVSGVCVAQSQASWVVLDPTGAGSSMSDFGPPETDETVYFDPGLDGGDEDESVPEEFIE